MSITILSQEEIDQIVRVEDYILRHPAATVADIRRRFHLTSEEYNMIFDICMPKVRAGSAALYWKIKYNMVTTRLDKILEGVTNNKLKDEIVAALEECEIGANNELAKREDNSDDNEE